VTLVFGMFLREVRCGERHFWPPCEYQALFTEQHMSNGATSLCGRAEPPQVQAGQGPGGGVVAGAALLLLLILAGKPVAS
jgi:hypothetical protein